MRRKCFKNDKQKFIKILEYLKKYINLTYTVVKALSSSYFCDNILTVFEQFIQTNLVDYFKQIVNKSAKYITCSTIDIFYKMDTLFTCNIETFINLTHNRKTNPDVLFHICNIDNKLKQTLLLNPSKLFKNIEYNDPTMKFICDIYSHKIVCDYVFESFSVESHIIKLEYLLEKYPQIATAYPLNEFIEKFVEMNSYNLTEILIFLKAHVENCNCELLSENSMIKILDCRSYGIGIITKLINYRIVDLQTYNHAKIIEHVLSACEKCVETDRVFVKRGDVVCNAKSVMLLFSLIKQISNYHTMFEWTTLINKFRLKSPIFSKFAKEVFATDSDVDTVSKCYIEECLR